VKSETFTLRVRDRYLRIQTHRLNDIQSAVVCWGTINAADSLFFHPINFSSVSLGWDVRMPGTVVDVGLLSGRQELIVLTNKRAVHTLDISNGAILQTVRLSSIPLPLSPILGSICYYSAHLIDAQTGREFDLRKEGVGVYYLGSSNYGQLCAKRMIEGNRLTILDWHSL
jgi:hypothetical protein